MTRICYFSDFFNGFSLAWYLTLKETTNHYMECNICVACLLDAYKAFDRVEFGKIFKLLLDMNLPTLIIRLILDGYTRQQIYVQYNSSWSNPIITTNGVKQGDFLSSILFSVYMGELLKRLKQQSIDNTFLGSFSYAVDLTLDCSSTYCPLIENDWCM